MSTATVNPPPNHASQPPDGSESGPSLLRKLRERANI